MTDLSLVASRLSRAADWLDHLIKGAGLQQWAVKAQHGRDVSDEGWSTLHLVGPDGAVLADCTPVIDDDALWVEAEARVQHMAAVDPRTVAALVPLLRHAAAGAARAQFDALSANEQRMVDASAAFAALLLGEEEQQ